MRLYKMMIDFLNAKDYIRVDYFVKKYSISKRTVQKDLSYLMLISSRKGYQLHMRRGKGYLIETTNQDLLKDFINSLQNDAMQIIADRIKDIAGLLCIKQGFVSMDSIAEVLRISKASVKNEMESVDKFVSSYHLHIEKKSHYGVRIVGKVKSQKKMLVDLFFDGNVFINSQIKDFVHAYTDIDTIIVKLLEKEDVDINYSELKNIIVWLEISAMYARVSNERGECRKQDMIGTTVVRRLAFDVKKILEDIYSIHFGTESMKLICEVIQKNIRPKKVLALLDEGLEQNIHIFLNEIDELYDTHFEEDDSFKKSLFIHVSLLIDRLHQKISYNNSLITEICVRYPMLFNIALRFSTMLKEKYNVVVTNDEAGFIATHFMAHMEKERTSRLRRFEKIGVVCSSGGGSAYFIKIQLASLFTKAEVVTFGFLEMDKLKSFNPDVIFTIMPLSQEFHVPVIFIKELLDDLDLVRIQRILQYDNYDFQYIEDGDAWFYRIFNKKFFHICKMNLSYLDLLQKMALQIEDSGYGGAHYTKYVMEREACLNTIYLHGVCIAHPIELCARTNLISVCILEKPIAYKQKEVKIIFMVALRKDDYEMHKGITRKLYQLMKNEHLLGKILKVKTIEEFFIVMKESEDCVI